MTFLQVPARDLARSLRDGRFLAAILTVNFVVVPLVVAVLFAFLPTGGDQRRRPTLVLLCPCVDYVIVFTGLADGDNRRLLSATPLLLLLQMALLPLYLDPLPRRRPARDRRRRAVPAGICLPDRHPAGSGLADPGLVGAQFRAGQRVATGAGALMVPLMAVVLAVVVASQIPRIDGQPRRTGPGDRRTPRSSSSCHSPAKPSLGCCASTSRPPVPSLSGATRNSPGRTTTRLALPTGYELAAAAVVVTPSRWSGWSSRPRDPRLVR